MPANIKGGVVHYRPCRVGTHESRLIIKKSPAIICMPVFPHRFNHFVVSLPSIQQSSRTPTQRSHCDKRKRARITMFIAGPALSALMNKRAFLPEERAFHCATGYRDDSRTVHTPSQASIAWLSCNSLLENEERFGRRQPRF